MTVGPLLTPIAAALIDARAKTLAFRSLPPLKAHPETWMLNVGSWMLEVDRSEVGTRSIERR